MKSLFGLTVLMLFYGLSNARYKRTTTTKKPIDLGSEESYEELLKSWNNPPPSLAMPIRLTPQQFANWVALAMFVPKGENVRPTNVKRFCGCKKRSLDSIVKRQAKRPRGRGRNKGRKDNKKGQDVEILRKEWRTMTKPMRLSFIKHFNNLAKKDPGKTTVYTLADWHRKKESPGAHGGPAFLPWHREFLFR